jgi:hypothetical protein
MLLLLSLRIFCKSVELKELLFGINRLLLAIVTREANLALFEN